MEEASGKYDPALYEIRANAITQIFYTHGYQNHAFSKSAGALVDLREHGYGSTQVFNVMLPVAQLQKAILLNVTPRRSTQATTRDERDIQSARYAQDLMRWADEEHRIAEIREQAATQFTEIGNFILFVGWDPTGGRFWTMPDGQMMFEGGPTFRCDSMFEWNFHPHAKDYRESPYAYRISYVSRDWALEHFPEWADKIPEDLITSAAATPVFQRTLLNMGPGAGFHMGGSARTSPKHEQFVEFHELYFRSSPKRPLGLCMFAFGEGGSPKVIVHKGENPYAERKTGRRTLPVIHCKNIARTGSLWGEAITQHMIPMQNYINQFEQIIAENAELIGNPFGYYWQDGIAPDNWNNEIGNIVPLAPGSQPPGWMVPPPLPNYVMDAPTRAMQYLNNLAQPMGPLQQENEGNITSGVQQAIVNEGKELRVAPMVAAWNQAWTAAWTQYIDNWANFQMLPRKIGVVGADGGWRDIYFSGALASGNFNIELLPGPALPQSKQAEIGTWIELAKTAPMQMLLQSNPAMMKKFLEDVGKGSEGMRMKKDPFVHIEKARRNITACKIGQIRQIDPLIDNVFDHIEVYQDYMASSEYEEDVTRDPTFDMRMRMLLMSCIQLQAQMMALQQQQMAEQQAGPDGGGGAPETQGGRGATEGGDAGHPRAHQGFGRSLNASRNNGGRPSSGGKTP